MIIIVLYLALLQKLYIYHSKKVNDTFDFRDVVSDVLNIMLRFIIVGIIFILNYWCSYIKRNLLCYQEGKVNIVVQGDRTLSSSDAWALLDLTQ